MPSSARIQVVIIDTDLRVLAALQTTIDAEADLEVKGAVSDLRDALATATEVVPSIVLIDVNDRSDGADLALIAQLSRLPGCRVVAMSVRPGFRELAQHAGAAAFVVKGEDVETVLTAVREAAAPDGKS